jgi:hypothetical protein
MDGVCSIAKHPKKCKAANLARKQQTKFKALLSNEKIQDRKD